ncbi:Gfo/Idh/MocA family protein [Sciscionella sediminilitoris]|uniref:Gfo/Idh/MocA family protein n=1 Tax=Sciscionella sediminilitoris TaxID=1445613 RepID=UPI0004DF9E7C|nr:Gfo/Idh/MocA family oxidoreductase [Sciscionella sp. SE31]
MPELRIGVVGLGQRAELATHAQRRGVARVVACADPAARGRADARALFGPEAEVYEDYERLFDRDLDAVFLLTPDYLHTAPALRFLERGIAVFVEKPLAIELVECDRILATAAQTGTRLFVGHNLRHLPVLREMRRLIDSGAIGSVRSIWCRHFVGHGGDYYFKDWHAERANTTGLLVHKGAHDLDVIHWLAGGFSRNVTAFGQLSVYGANPRLPGGAPDSGRRMADWFDPEIWPPSALRELNPVIDVEDLSMVLTRTGNGVLASYQQCHFTPDYWRNYTVIGDEGRMENFGDGTSGELAAITVWNRRRSGYRPDGDLRVTVDAQPEHAHGGTDAALVAEFLRFVAEGGPTETSPIAAREAVATGIAATTSLRSGGVPIPVPEPDPVAARYFAGNQARLGVPGCA